MPAETVVVLTVIVAMFAIFIVVVGSVWIWTNLPEPGARRDRQAAPETTTRPALN